MNNYTVFRLATAILVAILLINCYAEPSEGLPPHHHRRRRHRGGWGGGRGRGWGRVPGPILIAPQPGFLYNEKNRIRDLYYFTKDNCSLRGISFDEYGNILSQINSAYTIPQLNSIEILINSQLC